MKQILIVVYIISLFVSCNGTDYKGPKSEKKYGLDYNEKRKMLGIPILMDGWNMSVGKNGSPIYWRNPDKLMTGEVEKAVAFKDSVLIYDITTFWGKDSFATADGYERESIIIRYRQQSSSQYDEDSGISSFYTAESTNRIRRKISLKEVHTILKQWNCDY